MLKRAWLGVRLASTCRSKNGKRWCSLMKVGLKVIPVGVCMSGALLVQDMSADIYVRR